MDKINIIDQSHVALIFLKGVVSCVPECAFNSYLSKEKKNIKTSFCVG